MQDASTIWQSGYTPAVPFSIKLPEGGEIICDEVVRAMPGRRFVFKGRYKGNSVFIKVFSDNARAEREWRDERRCIAALREAAIPAPEIILSTSFPTPAMHGLVYKELVEAKSARDLWLQGDDKVRRRIVGELVSLLSTHHAAGMRQNDLHLHNFIYSEGVLYTLDAADIDVFSIELSKTDSFENLSSLLALFDSEYDDWIHELYSEYSRHRDWDISVSDEDDIRRKVKQGRKYKLRKYLSKIFRTCSAFVAVKRWNRFYVYDRREDDALFRELLSDPDKSPVAAHRHIIKNGNTCTVSSIEFAQRRLVCKRYNIKSFWHAVSRALRPTRAENSWRNAHLLLRKNIETPRPLALIENRFGPLRGSAWFIMQEVEGPSAREFFHDPNIGYSAQMTIANQFSELLGRMHREQISHGDMKATNFVINNGRLVVLDLDSLRQHRDKAGFELAFKRDLQRFFQNWQDLPEQMEMFREAFVASGLQNYLPVE